MSKAYLNALAEEGSRQELIEWLVRLDTELDETRQELKSVKNARDKYRQQVRDYEIDGPCECSSMGGCVCGKK